MGKIGGGGLILAGILLIMIGAIIQLDFIVRIINTILTVIGFVFVAGGIALGVAGIIMLFGGEKEGQSSEF